LKELKSEELMKLSKVKQEQVLIPLNFLLVLHNKLLMTW
jgi:hypothetical protein